MAPTLVATVQSAFARVLLTMTWPGITAATVQRLDPDGVLRNVRNAEPILCGGSCAFFDHEAPLDTPVSYRATSAQGSGAINANIYFEGGIANWTGANGATPASSGTQKHEGALAMRLTPDGVTANTQALGEEDPVVVGTTYGATAWLWSTSAFTWQVGISWYTAAHALISQSLVAKALGAGTWTNITASAAAPATAAYGRLTVQASGTPAGANLLYVDEAMLTSPDPLTVGSVGSTPTATDTYTRTVSNGVGTADTGQVYTINATAADYAANGTQATIQPSAINNDRIATIDVGSTDADVTVDVSIGSTPATGSLREGAVARYTDTSLHYLAEIQVSTTNTVTLRLIKRQTSSNVLTSVLTGLTFATSTLYRVRLRVTGTLLQAKVWLASAVEPVAWMLTWTDGSISTGTRAGFYARNDSAVTTHVFSFDNLTVNLPGVTVPSAGSPWLTDPGFPTYGSAAVVNDLSESYPQRRGAFQAIGASLPVIVSDVRGGATGTLTIQTNSAADTTRLRAMLGDGQPVLLRLPLTWGGDTWYLSLDTTGVDRFTRIATDNWRRWTLPYTRVDRPAGLSAGAVGITCADVPVMYATSTALTAAKATCTALATSVV